MTDERDLDRKVRTWLDDAPPGPPDRDAVYARVMDRLPETHQHRRWWPFQWNPFAAGATRSAEANGPHPQGRSRSMFSATRVVAMIAVVAIGGTLALMTSLGPSEVPAPAAVPGAQDYAYVTGTATHLGQTEACADTSTDLFFQKLGCAHEYEWTTDDPRLNGVWSTLINRRDPRGYPAGAAAISGTQQVENGDGGWVGTYQGVDLPGSAAMRLLGVATGTGAYEGLSAVVFHDTTGSGGIFDLEGVILGELPEPPAAASEDVMSSGPTSLSAEDIAYVTGTATWVRETEPGTDVSTDLFLDHDSYAHEYEWVTDDPRMSGPMSTVITRRYFSDADQMASIMVTSSIEDEVGGWVGTHEGVAFPGGTSLRLFSVHDGTGAHEGLSAVIFLETTSDGAIFDLEGVILPVSLLQTS